jgi:hypothetical protein
LFVWITSGFETTAINGIIEATPSTSIIAIIAIIIQSQTAFLISCVVRIESSFLVLRLNILVLRKLLSSNWVFSVVSLQAYLIIFTAMLEFALDLFQPQRECAS